MLMNRRSKARRMNGNLRSGIKHQRKRKEQQEELSRIWTLRASICHQQKCPAQCGRVQVIENGSKGHSPRSGTYMKMKMKMWFIAETRAT
mmetsp:Transcript_65725/g.137406  ORF Transcript_65725/g.137406 Transcript_65725/m.137406 type:complete len:90 (-) Transcript_65725:1449-1718(-)